MGRFVLKAFTRVFLSETVNKNNLPSMCCSTARACFRAQEKAFEAHGCEFASPVASVKVSEISTVLEPI